MRSLSWKSLSRSTASAAAIPGSAFFAMHGFNVVSCPWRKPEVALAQIDMLLALRKANDPVAVRAMGLMQTTWSEAGAFIRAYNGDDAATVQMKEAVNCYKTAMARLRSE